MTTGAFWNVDDPLKPWGLFDPDATLIFPIDISAWLLGMDAAYSSHTVITGTPLECVSPGTHDAGLIPVTIRVLSGATPTQGVKYPFTLRVVADNGQKDDRTLFLKIKSR